MSLDDEEGRALLRSLHDRLVSVEQASHATERRLAALEATTTKIAMTLETLFAWTASDEMRADLARRIQELSEPNIPASFEEEPRPGAGYRGVPAHLVQAPEPERTHCVSCGEAVLPSHATLSSRGPICAVCAADAET